MTAADRIPRPLPSGLIIAGYQAAICSWCGALVPRGPLVVVGGEIEPWTLHAEWHTSPRRDGRTDGDSAVMPIPAPEPGPRDARKPAQMPRQRISSPSGPDGARSAVQDAHDDAGEEGQ